MTEASTGTRPEKGRAPAAGRLVALRSRDFRLLLAGQASLRRYEAR
jgi:hypothetical protein